MGVGGCRHGFLSGGAPVPNRPARGAAKPRTADRRRGVSDPLPARTGGGAAALHQRFQTGDPFSQRGDVRAKVVPQIADLLLNIGPKITNFLLNIGPETAYLLLEHRSGDRRFRAGGRCAARRSAAAGSPSGRPAAPRSPTPAPTTARRLSTRGPKPPLSHRSPGQCRVRPTARQPLRAQDSSSLRAGAPVFFRSASPRAAGRNSPIVLPHDAAPNRDGAAPPTLRRGVLRRPRLGPGNQRAWRREFRGPWPRCRCEHRRSWPG